MKNLSQYKKMRILLLTRPPFEDRAHHWLELFTVRYNSQSSQCECLPIIVNTSDKCRYVLREEGRLTNENVLLKFRLCANKFLRPLTK